MEPEKVEKRKYKKSSHDRSPYLEMDERYKRRCLKCEKEFVAVGKFNRVCYDCKRMKDRGI